MTPLFGTTINNIKISFQYFLFIFQDFETERGGYCMKRVYTLLIFIMTLLHGLPLQGKGTRHGSQKIIQISVPKCGTHLLAKCIEFLSEKKHITQHNSQGFNNSKYYLLKPKEFDTFLRFNNNKFWVTHLFYDADYAQILTKLNFKKFFIYRDPRDQAVSLAFYMKRGTTWPKAAKMTLDEVLLDIITQGSTFNSHPPVKGLDELYRSYFSWFEEPEMLAIRFEDLIGAKGGGSDQVQRETIVSIAQHLGIELSEQKMQQIKDNLFGNTATFREGQVGGWKKYFKAHHIEAFKKSVGLLLVELGYEKDMNW